MRRKYDLLILTRSLDISISVNSESSFPKDGEKLKLSLRGDFDDNDSSIDDEGDIFGEYVFVSILIRNLFEEPSKRLARFC
jgi:hypothetical protein